MRRSQRKGIREKNGRVKFLLILMVCVMLSVRIRGREDAAPAAQPEGSGQEQSEESLFARKIADSFPEKDIEVPEYSGSPYAVLNNNIPFFDKKDLPAESFEYYSELDELGRCGIACANIGRDLMPTKEREGIGQVKPSGWHTVKYDNVDGNYLYNRCHLIGYQLSGENANEKNLITGTRYMNADGMLPFENMVADYVRETGNHVLYRVKPVFEGKDLLACGVLMEGWSVEDRGDGICFNVFVYNVQPDIVIDYAGGDSYPAEKSASSAAPADYILNLNTKKFHDPDCGSAEQTAEKNKQAYSGNREDVIAMGYAPCKECNP